ncbi:glycosyltransferase family 2 protein [Microbacterium sp. Mcb102]|uniref:glycosyltransferase family 2 protein n=1 Tax=Microbacterium sp. Mcb102 TaxID=2926012 RepID=UPI0021C9B886|nr:glycosyltransferase family 2 protein [Microbacterium sp. Mcb102]
MLLTIGIPTYNRAEDVRKTVTEILAHPDADLVEIIVIDDGGTDGTFEKLSADSGIAERVRVLENPENLGYAGTFARLFRECTTEYLMLTADDDRVLMENLRPLLEYLRREKPVFASPQFLRESRVSRGRTSTGPISPSEFLPASAHAPGLVYRVEECLPALDELSERVDAEEVDALVYPQVQVVMRLLIDGGRCEWLALPTVAEDAYRPSGIRDASGGAYWSLESRWKQLKSYDVLLSRWAEDDTTGRAREMLAAQRSRAFHLIASAIRIEDPVLGDAFDAGARQRYRRTLRSTIAALPIVAPAIRWIGGSRRRP